LNLLVEQLNLDDAVDLALAADEFLVLSLREHCVGIIQNLVAAETVWSTLNATHHVPSIALACNKVRIFALGL